MRFLHLSDLHIGKNVNGFSMLDEQRNAFKQVIGYLDTEKPDAVFIAGDIYDRTIPNVEAVRLFDDFLTDLAAKEVTVILISGNHDSPERLNYASRLLLERKLYLCGVFDGTLRSVILSDEYGELKFWLLPFVKPSGVRSMFADKKIESYTDAINVILKSANIDYSIRNVLLSHQFYTSAGITPTRSESEINPIGGLDAVDVELLSKFDYVALGHLHGAQGVGGSVRYAGSPIKYSFSEWKQKKSVTIVEIKDKGNVTITTLPLIPLHDMREIKGPLEQLMSDEVSSQGNREDYLVSASKVLTHIQQMEKKKTAIEEVRKLYSQGQTADAISRLTGHTWKTVTNYLKEDCPLNNGRYDQRMPGKLAPYEKAVIDMRSKGITYSKIHEYITEKGYDGTVASLRVFMQKERTHQQNIAKQSAEPEEYIPRKFMSQLIYRKLEDIKGLTQEQYEEALKKYPVLAELYALLKEFHRIVFSQKGVELDSWIETASKLQIDEIDSYIGGLKKDLSAVKNGINYEYNNGLAEGSVNKIKLAKRIMYGRNSFLLLKAKLLLNEYYYQIN